jgi:excisionase family DNA binding protein
MLLTINDLAERLRIKPSTLYAWVTQGKIPHLKIHRLIRFEPEDIDRWVQSFHKGASPPPSIRASASRSGTLDRLIANAMREVYSTRHGETRPHSSPNRKEGGDGAL